MRSTEAQLRNFQYYTIILIKNRVKSWFRFFGCKIVKIAVKQKKNSIPKLRLTVVMISS